MKGRRRNRPKQNKQTSIRAPLRRVTNLPQQVNPVTRIVRATSRRFIYNAAIGIDGFANFDMQLTFAPSATRYYIAGTSIYADSLPNVTEFSSLYDSWRISKITLRLDLPMGLQNSGLSPGSVIPQLMYAPDYNDAGSALKSALLQYPQVAVHNFNKDGYTPLMFEITPVALQEVSSGIVSTAYGALPHGTWLRTSQFDVQHYGVKMFFDNYGTTHNANYPLEFTIWYHMEFTNPM